mmetsp:Transcript_15959/g.54445  ORF Transcript_15959/g.54445 Transcript_15959/m.54445 type:complete len:384 (-) Transcript_15959:16-1167(-)
MAPACHIRPRANEWSQRRADLPSVHQLNQLTVAAPGVGGAAVPTRTGSPHSGLEIVLGAPAPLPGLGNITSLSTSEYLGRPASGEGAETLCNTSCSMSTSRPGLGRTNTPVSVPGSRKSVSASKCSGQPGSRYTRALTNRGRPSSRLQYKPKRSAHGASGETSAGSKSRCHWNASPWTAAFATTGTTPPPSPPGESASLGISHTSHSGNRACSRTRSSWSAAGASAPESSARASSRSPQLGGASELQSSSPPSSGSTSVTSRAQRAGGGLPQPWSHPGSVTASLSSAAASPSSTPSSTTTCPTSSLEDPSGRGTVPLSSATCMATSASLASQPPLGAAPGCATGCRSPHARSCAESSLSTTSPTGTSSSLRSAPTTGGSTPWP